MEQQNIERSRRADQLASYLGLTPSQHSSGESIRMGHISLEAPMKWYHYVAGFFAGVFLTNAVPHFVNGISGSAFPTPFSDPPGKGHSSPLTNVLWALFNLLAGYLLFRISKLNSKSKLGLAIFFAGMILLSISPVFHLWIKQNE
ncbi:MAG: transposase [Candidatus Kryptoniota bacterium]